MAKNRVQEKRNRQGFEDVSSYSSGVITKDPVELGFHEEAIKDDKVINIAMFGVDTRNSSYTGLSDVNMILTVDNRHGKVKLTSILRDSLVHIEGQADDGGYRDVDTKMNAAYSWGGPKMAIHTLNQNFGLRIEDYVTINFVNMAAIVDAFGGVEMEVTADEVSEINLNLSNLVWEVEDKKQEDMALGIYEGMNYPQVQDSDYMTATGDVDTYLLNGNQAVCYGRIRNIGSDFARVERQQKVLQGLIERLKRMSVTDYPNMVKQLMPYCETSLELNDIVSMLPILTTDLSVEKISVPDMELDNPQDIKYDLVYDLTQASKRISAFMYEEGSPYWSEYNGTGNAGVGKNTD